MQRGDDDTAVGEALSWPAGTVWRALTWC